MASHKSDDQKKTPDKSRKEELSAGDLDKVTGGLKKNTTGGRGRTEDPCGGGE